MPLFDFSTGGSSSVPSDAMTRGSDLPSSFLLLRPRRPRPAGGSLSVEMFTRTSVALLWLGLWAAPCFAPQAPLADRLACGPQRRGTRQPVGCGKALPLNAALVEALGKRADEAFSRYDFANTIEVYAPWQRPERACTPVPDGPERRGG